MEDRGNLGFNSPYNPQEAVTPEPAPDAEADFKWVDQDGDECRILGVFRGTAYAEYLKNGCYHPLTISNDPYFAAFLQALVKQGRL